MPSQVEGNNELVKNQSYTSFGLGKEYCPLAKPSITMIAPSTSRPRFLQFHKNTFDRSRTKPRSSGNERCSHQYKPRFFNQMSSDHNRSELLGIQDHSNEQSSSKLVPKVVP
ncbi:hypothetical protein Tco_0867911 [Tanacetum coccineum]